MRIKKTPGRPKFFCPPRGAGWAKPSPGGIWKQGLKVGSMFAITALVAACGGGGGGGFALPVLPPTPAPEPAKPYELTILHINDHHSTLDGKSRTLKLKTGAGDATTDVTVDAAGFPRVATAFQELARTRPTCSSCTPAMR